MNLRKSAWQFLIAGIVVTIALGVYADLGALVTALDGFDWWLLPLVLALTLLNQTLRFLKWEYLLGEVDVNLPLRTSLHVFGSGLIMIVTPGKFGEVWKSWLVRDLDGTPMSRTLPVVAVERISDLLGVVTISLLGVVAFDRSVLLLVALTTPVILVILLLQSSSACLWLLGMADRLPLFRRWSDNARQLYRSSRELLRPRPLGVVTVVSVASWGMECVGLWLVLRGFDTDVGLLATSFVFASSSILGAVSLLPGGLGVTEGSMTGLLSVFGVGRATATSATLVVRAVTLWFSVLLGVVFYTSLQWQYSPDTDPSHFDETLE